MISSNMTPVQKNMSRKHTVCHTCT